MVARLAPFTLVLSALALGATAPLQAQEAEVPGLVRVSDGEAVTVQDLQGERYTALHFLLKTECPICQRHTHRHAGAFAEDDGVAAIFIKPDDLATIRGWTEGVDGAPEIYQDPEAALAAHYAIPDGYRFHGEDVHYPALILLDADGQEVWRFVGESNRQRVSVERLREVIAALEAGEAVE